MGSESSRLKLKNSSKLRKAPRTGNAGEGILICLNKARTQAPEAAIAK